MSQLDEIDFIKLRKNNFQDFIKENELADESLVNFLEDVDIKDKSLERYQQYLKDTGKATSMFSGFTQKATSVLKSFGAAMASMAVMWAIGEIVSLVVKGFDNLAHSAEHCKEWVDRQKDYHKI